MVRFLPLGLVFGGFFLSFGAYAADQIPSIQRIGIVKVWKIFDGYKRTSESDAKLEGLSSAKEKERQRFVSEIQQMREELILFNEEGRRERQKAIEEKLKSLASFDRQVKEGLRRQRDEEVKSILDEIELAVASYAKEKGFELILSDRAVLYGIDAVDVTDEILMILNERYAKKKSP